jgi:LPPG:FO 2-phospho-L-lactate transferase
MEPGPDVTVLAGGVGGARFLQGLAAVLPPERITVVGNVGDDFEILGLHVSPDLDTVLYTLAGVVNEESGWGRRPETAHALEVVGELGGETWFFLGDRDLGLHLVRTERLRRGETLSAITDDVRRRLGLRVRLLPASDDPVRTVVTTDRGEMDFQTYFVRYRHEPEVRAVRFEGADGARPAPGVLGALAEADLVVVAPSNPFLSIDPILAVPGVTEALSRRGGPIAAVTPVVAGRAVKGPADRLLRTFAGEASPAAVARHYASFLTHMLVDRADAASVDELEAVGVRAAAANTIMRDRSARAAVARATLDLALSEER